MILSDLLQDLLVNILCQSPQKDLLLLIHFYFNILIYCTQYSGWWCSGDIQGIVILCICCYLILYIKSIGWFWKLRRWSVWPNIYRKIFCSCSFPSNCHFTFLFCECPPSALDASKQFTLFILLCYVLVFNFDGHYCY